jgi:hypothetical protein
MPTVLLGLSLAGNLVKPLISLYGTKWRDRDYGLRNHAFAVLLHQQSWKGRRSGPVLQFFVQALAYCCIQLPYFSLTLSSFAYSILADSKESQEILIRIQRRVHARYSKYLRAPFYLCPLLVHISAPSLCHTRQHRAKLCWYLNGLTETRYGDPGWGNLQEVNILHNRVHSHAPSIRSHRGIKVVWPDFQPMRVPEEPVCVHLFRQKPVFTSLHLKSPVHVHRLRGIPTKGEKMKRVNWEGVGRGSEDKSS